jgi:hypothetical protein
MCSSQLGSTAGTATSESRRSSLHFSYVRTWVSFQIIKNHTPFWIKLEAIYKLQNLPELFAGNTGWGFKDEKQQKTNKKPSVASHICNPSGTRCFAHTCLYFFLFLCICKILMRDPEGSSSLKSWIWGTGALKKSHQGTSSGPGATPSCMLQVRPHLS